MLLVLHLLNSERNAFGLRNKEYDRYKKHLTSKIHNLRKSTGLTHGGAKGGYKKPAQVSHDSVSDVRYA
jgi:signal recognition particle subunit SRP68